MVAVAGNTQLGCNVLDVVVVAADVASVAVVAADVASVAVVAADVVSVAVVSAKVAAVGVVDAVVAVVAVLLDVYAVLFDVVENEKAAHEFEPMVEPAACVFEFVADDLVVTAAAAVAGLSIHVHVVVDEVIEALVVLGTNNFLHCRSSVSSVVGLATLFAAVALPTYLLNAFWTMHHCKAFSGQSIAEIYFELLGVPPLAEL